MQKMKSGYEVHGTVCDGFASLCARAPATRGVRVGWGEARAAAIGVVDEVYAKELGWCEDARFRRTKQTLQHCTDGPPHAVTLIELSKQHTQHATSWMDTTKLSACTEHAGGGLTTRRGGHRCQRGRRAAAWPARPARRCRAAAWVQAESRRPREESPARKGTSRSSFASSFATTSACASVCPSQTSRRTA